MQDLTECWRCCFVVLQYSSQPQQAPQQQRVPTAASPATTNSSGSSSSNAGSQNGTISTSVSTGGTGSEQLSKTNLYIRGLNQNTTDKDLVNMCSQWVNHPPKTIPTWCITYHPSSKIMSCLSPRICAKMRCMLPPVERSFLHMIEDADSSLFWTNDDIKPFNISTFFIRYPLCHWKMKYTHNFKVETIWIVMATNG